MGELDLAGFDDCGDDFAEIDTDTLEHVRHSAYWAANTGRGQDWEEPTRWIDVESTLQQAARPEAVAHIASVGTDLAEIDPRVLKAVYRATPGEALEWSAEVTTQQGTVYVEGPLQTLPQDAERDDGNAGPAYNVPVSAGAKTIRQVALDGGPPAWFPHWLVGRNSGKIVYSIGLLLDMATEWLYRGIQQRMPLVAHEGALPHLGRDLGITRGFRESVEAYRRRLSLWAPTHRRWGVPFAIAEQAQAYFAPQSPRVHVVQHDPGAGGKPTRATWNTRHPDGSETVNIVSPSNFDYDSEDAGRPPSLEDRDPRIWIIVEQPSEDSTGLFALRTSTAAQARDPNGMNGLVRPTGDQAPADQYRDLVSIAHTWRAMGTWIAGVLVSLAEVDPAGTSAHPDGRWFDMLNDAKDGPRLPDTMRILYVDRYPGERLPESPAPYEV